MGFYVVAFVDRAMKRRRILGRWYQTTAVGGVFAVGERRTTAPSLTDEALTHQHRVVERLAMDYDAILPVRFGTLSTESSLGRLPAPAIQRLTAGLDDVRGRVQMTVRFIGEPDAAVVATPATSGRAYLESRRDTTRARLPAAAERWLDEARGLVQRERIEAGAGSLLATVYHLVRREDLDRYVAVTAGAMPAGGRISGPFPPFAFTPSIL